MVVPANCVDIVVILLLPSALRGRGPDVVIAQAKARRESVPFSSRSSVVRASVGSLPDDVTRISSRSVPRGRPSQTFL